MNIMEQLTSKSFIQSRISTFSCWIDVKSPVIWAFVAPITVVIIINLIILVIALRVVLSVKTRDRTTQDKIFGWLKGSTLLLCLLGITWIFGYLTAVPTGEPVFAYIFTILNVLQVRDCLWGKLDNLKRR